MRGVLTSVGIFAALAAHAQVTMFNANNPVDNDSVRSSWLAAAGVLSPQFAEDFESYSIGTALSGVPLVGGLTVTDTNVNPIQTVQSSSAFFGGSTPFGQGLALREGHTYEFVFATPVYYVGMYDIDQGDSDIRVFLADNTSVDFINLDSTASAGLSGEFFGFVSTGPAITGLRFVADGGDNEMGLDSIEYGAVPEPATMIALALGAAVIARRKRK